MDRVKKLAASLCFAVLLCAVLVLAASVLERKVSVENYARFWEDPTEYDVWFMGTSHAYYAIQPMDLWEQYGIRSYNLAASSSSLPQTYWTLMCALEQAQPKVVVLDVFKVHLDEKHQDDRVPHVGLDSIPLSATKAKGICDLFDTWEERFEYICKFSIYHSRWEELGKRDFRYQKLPRMGSQFKDRLKDYSDFRYIAKEDMSSADTVGFYYLEKIIGECQKRGIQLVLTEFPFCGSEEEQRGANAVPGVAKAHGVEFLDMAHEEGLLDYSVDFGDRNHVNLFGSKKLTRYMGDYLSQHCGLKDYRDTPEVAEKWNADFVLFLQEKAKRMKAAKKLKSYVQWLSDDRYGCYLYQEKAPDPRGGLARELAQLNNIHLISKKEAEERMGGEILGGYAFIVENEKGEVVDQAVFRKGKRQ